MDSVPPKSVYDFFKMLDFYHQTRLSFFSGMRFLNWKSEYCCQTKYAVQSSDFKEADFKAVEFQFIRRFKKKPSLEAILLMIGYQECPTTRHSREKEEKVDLINLGVQVVLEKLGFFKKTGYDNGWPQFSATDLKTTDDKEQLVKHGIVLYFRENGLLS